MPATERTPTDETPGYDVPETSDSDDKFGSTVPDSGWIGPMLALLASMFPTAGQHRTNLNRILADEKAQTDDLPGVILMVGIAVVGGFIVLYLASQTISAINMSEGDPLYPAFEALQSATTNAFEIFGILFIVALLAVALMYLWRIRGGAR